MKYLMLVILVSVLLSGCTGTEAPAAATASEHILDTGLQQAEAHSVVVDLTAPKVQVTALELYEAVGLTPENFTVSVEDESKVISYFKTAIDYTDTNRQMIKIIYQDASGNRTEAETSLRISKVKAQVTVELDEGMPGVEEFIKNPDDLAYAIYARNYTIKLPGSLVVGIYVGDVLYESELVVIDNIPPAFLLEPVMINWGEKVSAAAFVTKLLEESDTTIGFETEPDWNLIGEQTVAITVTDSGENAVTKETMLTILPDTMAPELTGVENRVVEQGIAISYKKGITATDLHDGEVPVMVDSSTVNFRELGEYTVIYSAADVSGNVATQSAIFTVVSSAGDYDALMTRIQEVKEQLITEGMSMREQAYVICRFGRKIKYTGYSNKEDWVAAALDGLNKGSGDCYTAYIISKLLLDACGIPNIEVERLRYPGESRHYWSIVNCGDGWYYFDSSVHSWIYQFETFMFTEEERIAYCEMRGGDGYFYRYDRTLYDIEIVQGEPTVMVALTPEPEDEENETDGFVENEAGTMEDGTDETGEIPADSTE